MIENQCVVGKDEEINKILRSKSSILLQTPDLLIFNCNRPNGNLYVEL